VSEKESLWISKNESLLVTNNLGERIKLEVPIETNRDKKTRRVFFRDLIKAEHNYNIKQASLEPIDIHPLLLIYAKLKWQKGGFIKKAYRLRKMIFYLGEDVKKLAHGDAFTFDEIVSARAGPTPKNLQETMKRLKDKGLVEYTWENKPGTSAEFKLTEKGEQAASNLWANLPEDVKKIITKVKEDIYLLSSEQLRNKVHKEYPEYKKTYTELDND